MSRYIADAMRHTVARRANYCCEYCLIQQDISYYAFQIDHIISLKHGGETSLENLAYSCFPCNVNKSSDVGTILLPERIFIRLFNPRIDHWEEHFSIKSGMIYPHTAIGRATIKVLKINDVDRILERR